MPNLLASLFQGKAPQNSLADSYSQSEMDYLRSLSNVKQNRIPEALRTQEQGLEAPPISPDDLIGTGLITKAALLAKAGIAPLAAMAGLNAIAAKKGVGIAPNALANVMRKQAGMFAGVNAKTANKEMLAKAEEMAKQGIPDAQIWKETGWTLNTPDKMPRFEIPDNAAKFKPTKWKRPYENALDATEANLGDAMSHDALYGAYDDLAGMPVVNQRNLGDIRGQYNPPNENIGLRDYIQMNLDKDARLAQETETAKRFLTPNDEYGMYWRDLVNESISEGLPRKDAVMDVRNAILEARRGRDELKSGVMWPSSDSSVKSTTLHELQHAIQQREGFARGGSPEQFKVSQEALSGLHSYDDMAHAQRILEMAKKNNQSIDDWMKKPPRWVTDKQLAIAKQFESRPESDLKYAMDYVLGAQSPHEAYQRLAGEAEARLTQARMAMTPEQRAAQYPYDPAYFEQATGVPLNSLIVRKEGGTAMSLPYQIEHKPMTVSGGASTLDDLTSAFGEDIYGKHAIEYFGSGDAREKAVLNTLRAVRGKPDAKVTIYRGLPESAEGINAGDWVTLHPSVAQDYADLLAEQGTKGKVVKMEVPASSITSWPDSLLEFGYYPK